MRWDRLAALAAKHVTLLGIAFMFIVAAVVITTVR